MKKAPVWGLFAILWVSGPVAELDEIGGEVRQGALQSDLITVVDHTVHKGQIPLTVKEVDLQLSAVCKGSAADIDRHLRARVVIVIVIMRYDKCSLLFIFSSAGVYVCIIAAAAHGAPEGIERIEGREGTCRAGNKLGGKGGRHIKSLGAGFFINELYGIKSAYAL